MSRQLQILTNEYKLSPYNIQKSKSNPLAYSSLTHGIFYEKTCCINRILRSSEISVGKERVRTSADRYRGLPDRFRIRPSEAC